MAPPTNLRGPQRPALTPPDAATLQTLAQALHWVGRGALGMVDHANNKPENKGRKPKVGGHQASSLSSLDILVALYLHVLRPGDRVAVKPHAAPVLYALMHLLGRLPTAKMGRLREMGGPQPYPTPAKNPDFVDYTSSSEGLGVAATIYDAYALAVQNHGLRARLGGGEAAGADLAAPIEAVHFALCGDGELTEGQVDESLYDAGRWRLPGLVWIIDCNRQSLDRVMDDTAVVGAEAGAPAPGRLDAWIEAKFRAQGWAVEQLRWGAQAEALFARPGGASLRQALDRAPDAIFHALSLLDGRGIRALLRGDKAAVAPTRHALLDRAATLWPRSVEESAAIAAVLAVVDDITLQSAVQHLGGHDLALLCDALQRAATAGQPVCLVAHTTKGYRSSLAGHPENHGALMPSDEALAFGAAAGVPAGEHWPVPGADAPAGLRALLAARAALLYDGPATSPLDHGRSFGPAEVLAPLGQLAVPARREQSTGEAFQSLNMAILRTPAAPYLHAGAPDVGQTTHLGPIIKETGVFAPRPTADAWDWLRDERALAFDWRPSAQGQFHALGIAEGNAMLWAGAMGRPRKAMEGRAALLPVVTVYDKFVERALNQLDVALYSGSRFVLVGVPSGTGLSRETFTHQSVGTLRIVMDVPGICAWEPAFAADVAAIYGHALADLWRPDGEAHYLRLTTQPLQQPSELPPDHAAQAIAGAWWMVGEDARAAAPGQPTVVLAGSGRKLACVRAAAAALQRDHGVGSRILVVTSFERLWRSWDTWASDPSAWNDDSRGHVLDRLFDDDALLRAPMVVAVDASPSVAEWMAGALQRVHPVRILAPRRWGETGDLASVDRLHGMHADDIVAAVLAELRFRQGA